MNDNDKALIEAFITSELKSFSSLEKDTVANMALLFWVNGYDIRRPDVVKALEHLANYGHFLQGLNKK